MAGERYALFGVIPTEREVNEPMELDEQNIGDSGDVLIYETDDRDEAGEIYRAGGFERNGKWHAVTRVVDRTKQSAPSAATHSLTSPVPNKRDYDQS